MKYSIGKTISKSIKENKWISIEYKNQKNEITSFWCTVQNIYIEKKILVVDMFNAMKGIDVINVNLNFENIQRASIVEGTFYEPPVELIHKIEKNINELKWLEYDNFDDKILEYYSEAKKLDVDPYQEDYCKVSGIDAKLLLTKKKYPLSNEQFEKIAVDIFKNDLDDKKRAYKQLSINKLSIYSSGKIYVIAYYPLKLNIKTHELVIKDHLIINKSFLIGDNKVSLSTYLSITPEKFTELLNTDYSEGVELLRDNLKSIEKVDENPFLMLIGRDISLEYDKVFEYIAKKHKDGELEQPLKAFFGETSRRVGKKIEPNIVLIDKKADIDQVRVVYNAMKNPVTYVQGPPGTGKTTTILNVILSLFLNEETCLICSNNNHPLDGIFEKFSFTFKGNKVLFPIVRLGNRFELAKTIQSLNELFSLKLDREVYESKLREISNETASKYDGLKQLLNYYEAKKEAKESLAYLNRYLDFVVNSKDSSSKLKETITKKKKEFEDKINSIPDVYNDDVLSKVISAKDDHNFMMFLFYNSYKYIKHLQGNAYEDLRKICSIEDEDTRITEFSKYLKDDAKFKKFLRAFPIVVCTNISCLKLGDNNTYFDMCIMDEAGQCDVACSLIPLSKAKRLLLVGDVNQLQPVITLDDSINEKLMEKYEIKSQYDYCNNSIINLMSMVDDVSTNILLSYHYRCGKKIAEYSNQRYYDGKLNIKTSLDGNQLTYIDVHNDFFAAERNSYEAEAKAVVRYIKDNKLEEQKVSIITPFRNQSSLLRRLLKENGLEVQCGTIHTVQGAENDTVIFSPCIGVKSSRKTYEWLANNKELINVAVTRAKNKLVFVADEKALKALSDKEKEDDIIALSDYVKEKGEYQVSKSTVNKIDIGLSNDSQSEAELFDTVTHFCSVYKKFTIRRNQPVNKVLSGDVDPKLLKYFNKAEFDLVLYAKNLFGKTFPHVIIELNGGEHYFSNERQQKNDKKKIDICKKFGIKYISIPNAYSRSYETLSNLIITLNGEKDEDYNLFTLLDEMNVKSE